MGERASGHSAGAASSDQFEALYLALRRRLLLQCFALTGDLSAARSGVREAFIAARQQWRRVGPLEHPEAWIRQRAMNTTQRRHVPHRRRAHQGLDDQQIAVVSALAEMKDGERKALILRYLGDLDTLSIGRDLSITERSAQQRLNNAESTFVRGRGCERVAIASELRSLAPVVTHPGLPRARSIHDRAHRRARLQIVLGVVMAAVLATIGGLLIRPTESSDALALINARPVTRGMFLTPGQVDAFLAGTWQQRGVNTITRSSGPQDACHRDALADNNAAGAWVKKFQSSAGTSLTQRTEVSIGTNTADATYATTRAWYANCSQAPARVVSAAQLKGVGNHAWLFQIDVAQPATTYQVVVAQQGMIINTLALATPATKGSRAAPTSTIAALAQQMMRSLCQASAAETCAPAVPVEAVPAVPYTVEYPGMLVAADLPVLPKITRPWVGTRPVKGGPNLAATQCDTTTFAGATTHARTFLIPEAKMPATFGITETLATYPTAAAAAKTARTITSLMASCHKRQVGTQVDQRRSMPANQFAPAVFTWHEVAESSTKKTVTYWMGVAQYGATVAQVTFIPAGNANTTASGFLAVMERAAQRLSMYKP